MHRSEVDDSGIVREIRKAQLNQSFRQVIAWLSPTFHAATTPFRSELAWSEENGHESKPQGIMPGVGTCGDISDPRNNPRGEKERRRKVIENIPRISLHVSCA